MYFVNRLEILEVRNTEDLMKFQNQDLMLTRNSEEFTGGAESLTFSSPYPAVKTTPDIKLF